MSAVPPKRFVRAGSAPASFASVTMSRSPSAPAYRSTLSERLSRMSTSAPASTSAPTAPVCRARAATMRGARPSSSGASTAAPSARGWRIVRMSPAAAAAWRRRSAAMVAPVSLRCSLPVGGCDPGPRDRRSPRRRRCPPARLRMLPAMTVDARPRRNYRPAEMPPLDLSDVVRLRDFEAPARERIHPAAWEYLSSGAYDEHVLRNTRDAWDAFRLRPRVLTDVSNV